MACPQYHRVIRVQFGVPAISAVKLLHAVRPISQHGMEVHKLQLSKGVMYLDAVTWMLHLWT